jgi:gallate dioxygenase
MATIVAASPPRTPPPSVSRWIAKKHQDPVWAPIFAGYEPVSAGWREKKPDVLFFVYNDHITSFFFDHYSHFALGVGAKYWVADEGGGARKLPPISGHPAPRNHSPPACRRRVRSLPSSRRRASTTGCFSAAVAAVAA